MAIDLHSVICIFKHSNMQIDSITVNKGNPLPQLLIYTYCLWSGWQMCCIVDVHMRLSSYDFYWQLVYRRT